MVIGVWIAKYIDEILTGEKLKKAQLQDEVVLTIFDTANDAVFHGGTAVWRCYGGKRFSKDLDIYFYKDKSLEKISNNLISLGLKIQKDRQRKEKFAYSVSGHGADISLQFTKKRVRGVVSPYQNSDGTFITVYSLSPEWLILEKIRAYDNRRDERDIYDMMILTNSVSNKTLVLDKTKNFLANVKKPARKEPIGNLVYEGIVPSFEQMVEYLRNWCKS